MITEFSHNVEGMVKVAMRNPSAVSRKRKEPTVLGTMGQGLAGLGTGIVAGYGLGKALEVIARKQRIPLTKLIPTIVSTAGGAVGIAYPLWKTYELDALRRAAARRAGAS